MPLSVWGLSFFIGSLFLLFVVWRFWGCGLLASLGVLDFAGGTVVHINCGIAGLVAAIVLGERKQRSRPHNLLLSLIGTSLDMDMASSSVSKESNEITGPNISSFAIFILVFTSVKIVGLTKNPLSKQSGR